MKQAESNSPEVEEYRFLSGGGEMGNLIRSKDWSGSLVGTPDTWPQSLRTTLSIILNSKFPMFLFWGPDLVCFYNDAYRPSLGNEGKHPNILGSRGEDYWQEIWPVIKPLIDQVLAGGEATWSEDQLIPIYRNGKMEDVYWTFSYSPVNDESGKPAGVFVTCNETTDKINNQNKLEESIEDLRNMVLESPVGICVIDATTLVSEIVNDSFIEVAGKTKEEIIGKYYWDTFAEARPYYESALAQVVETGTPFHANEVKLMLIRHGKEEDVYVTFVYAPLKNAAGRVKKIAIWVLENTQQVTERKKIEEADKRFRTTVRQAPVGITILRGPEFVVEMANDAYLQLVDKKEADFVGRPLFDSLPEVKEAVHTLLNDVLNTGIPFNGMEYPITVNRYGRSELSYFNFLYHPLKEDDGKISGIIVTVTDVSDSVKAKQYVTENEEKLNIVIDASELGTWELDLKTKAITYSDRHLEILGHNRGEVVDYEELVKQLHPDDLLNRDKAFEKAFETGTLHYQTRVIYKDGSVHWVEGRGKVFYDEEGKPFKLIGTSRDITEVRQREENMARFAAIVQSSTDAIISKDLNGIITSWNPAAEQIFGYTEKEMIGQPLIRLIPPDRMDEETSILLQIKSGERVNHFETKRITKSNEILDISLNISPIRGIHGNIIGASKIARDITPQKEAERQIAANEQKFRMLADSMPQFVWTGDAAGNLNYFNQAVYQYSGLSKEQVKKEGWLQIVHPDDREANVEAWIYAVQTGTDFIFEHRFGRHDGEYRWQLSRAIPQRDAAGNIQMWVGSSTDIQEIKEQDQQKDFFISMASHELKTPITSIKGYIQLLQNAYAKTEDPLLKRSLTIIDKQIVTLTSLIADLLDVSKIKSGSLVLNKQDFEITEMISEVANQIQHVNPDHHITFSGKPATVFADRERISQVLINLLTNAVKYSPNSNEIIIKNFIEDDHVVVSVHDSGIGISKIDQEKIFERFYRVEGKDERTYPGFGIGLFISSEIIQRHDGKISVSSQPGKGSVFYFSIPLKK